MEREPTLVLRTPGELILAYVLAASVSNIGESLFRTLGLSKSLVSTVSWPVDLGVDVVAAIVWGLIFCLVRSRNDLRDLRASQ